MIERRLRREILLAIGRMPDVLVHPNPVGVGYTQAVRADLARVLSPFGSDAVSVAMAVLNRRRLEYGLGTGSPDMVGCVAGRAFGLELKNDTGVLSMEQRAWHAGAAGRGFAVAVVRSADAAVGAIGRVRAG
jgi:hypothetical protein